MQRISRLFRRRRPANGWTALVGCRRTTIVAVALAAVAAVGCLDAERLTTARRDIANGLKLVEVDLGRYRVSLPKLPGEPGGGVVDFHAFGQVTNRDKAAVDEQLKLRVPELRHRMLLAVRRLPEQRIDEPGLDALRERVGQVVNDVLGEELIRGVGFYEFSFFTL